MNGDDMVIVDTPAGRYPVHKGWMYPDFQETLDSFESQRQRRYRQEASRPGVWISTPQGWVFEEEES